MENKKAIAKAVFVGLFCALSLFVSSCKKEQHNTLPASSDHSVPKSDGEPFEMSVNDDGSISDDIKWSGITFGLTWFYKNPITYTPNVYVKSTDTTLSGKSYKIYKSIVTPTLSYLQQNSIDSFWYQNSRLLKTAPHFYTGYPTFSAYNLKDPDGQYIRVVKINGNSNIPSMTYVTEDAEDNPSIQMPDEIVDRTKDLIIPVHNCDFVHMVISDTPVSRNGGYFAVMTAKTYGRKYFYLPANLFKGLKGSSKYSFKYGVYLYKYRGMRVSGKNFLYIYQTQIGDSIYLR